MIENLIFGVYLLFPDFLVRGVKVNKTSQKVQVTIQFRSKNLTHFTNLNSLNIIKKYTTAIQPKTCFWSVLERTFALHHF